MTAITPGGLKFAMIYSHSPVDSSSPSHSISHTESYSMTNTGSIN